MTKKLRKAVFPVGGLGTRSLPATKAIPKEMLTIVDKPLIQYALEEARAAGIEQFIFVTSRGKSTMEDHFDVSYELEATLAARNKKAELEALRQWLPSIGQVVYTRQQEPLGLGHAVLCAAQIVGDEPFAVLLPDDIVLAEKPCLAQMAEAYADVGGNLVAVMDVPREQTNKYGIVAPGATDGRLTEVKGLVEKPKPEDAPSTLSVIGRYIIQPEVFGYLNRRERGAGNEIQLTDSLARLIGEQPFHGFRYDGTRYDCGDKSGFLAANIAFGLARPDVGPGLADFIRGLKL
jgi:UTP--glucose-1-phosphate uridylyltransferase